MVGQSSKRALLSVCRILWVFSFLQVFLDTMEPWIFVKLFFNMSIISWLLTNLYWDRIDEILVWMLYHGRHG